MSDRIESSQDRVEPNARTGAAALQFQWDIFGNPKMEDVRQSERYPDCYIEASLAALSSTASGRELIRSLIKRNGDNSYTVTFPGDVNHPIVVGKDESAKFGSTRNSALWAQVVERALLQYNGANTDGTIPAVAAAYNVDDILALMTGNFVDTTKLLWNDKAKLRDKLEHDIIAALREDRPIVAGSARKSSELPAQHAYTVINYDDQTHTITLRNPWANMNGTPLENKGAEVAGIKHLGDGVLQMSMQAFMDHMFLLYIGNVGSPKQMQSGGSNLVQLNSSDALSVCPRTSWVPATLMNDYLPVARDPQAAITTSDSASDGDYVGYRVERGKQRYLANIQKGGNPANPDDVYMLSALGSLENVVDFYKLGNRNKASFLLSDPTKPGDFKSIDATINRKYGQSYVGSESGTVFHSGIPTESFVAKFNQDGQIVSYDTGISEEDLKPTNCHDDH
jgi:hypothetical protein